MVIKMTCFLTAKVAKKAQSAQRKIINNEFFRCAMNVFLLDLCASFAPFAVNFFLSGNPFPTQINL